MIKKTIAWLQQVVLTQISYSFDEACLNPVAFSKNKTHSYTHCGDFFFIKWPLVLTNEGNEMAEK